MGKTIITFSAETFSILFDCTWWGRLSAKHRSAARIVGISQNEFLLAHALDHELHQNPNLSTGCLMVSPGIFIFPKYSPLEENQSLDVKYEQN